MSDNADKISALVGYVGIGLVVLIGAATVLPVLHQPAILICGMIWPAAGALLGIGVVISSALASMGTKPALENFSSFDPATERNFVVFEKTSNERAASANITSAAIVGALAVVIVLIVTVFHDTKNPPLDAGKDNSVHAADKAP